VLRNTYFLLSLTLAFSALVATASTVLMLPSPGLILTLVGMYGLMFLTYRLANKPTGIIAAFAFTGFLGYILGPILNAYLSAGMGDVIGMALGGTLTFMPPSRSAAARSISRMLAYSRSNERVSPRSRDSRIRSPSLSNARTNSDCRSTSSTVMNSALLSLTRAIIGTAREDHHSMRSYYKNEKTLAA
jgi:hypothetical protein